MTAIFRADAIEKLFSTTTLYELGCCPCQHGPTQCRSYCTSPARHPCQQGCRSKVHTYHLRGRHNYWTLACFQIKSRYVHSLLSSFVVKENGWKLNAMDSVFLKKLPRDIQLLPNQTSSNSGWLSDTYETISRLSIYHQLE
jgi:hypothetical protein